MHTTTGANSGCCATMEWLDVVDYGTMYRPIGNKREPPNGGPQLRFYEQTSLARWGSFCRTNRDDATIQVPLPGRLWADEDDKVADRPTDRMLA